MTLDKPKLNGVGIGLRACHYAYIEKHQPNIPWFEVLSDNYLSAGGSALSHLDAIAAQYPVTLHGVGLSLGSTDPLNITYLHQLKTLIQRVHPMLVSDHLSWTSWGGRYFHELLPLPYTEEAVLHVATRLQQAQDFLGQRLMIENVSHYLSYQHSTLTEWEFLQAVADQADAWILLDINNVYVSAQNNHFNPLEYLNGLSAHRIAQFHLAGFEQKDHYLLDTHGANIAPPVWELFRHAIQRFGPIPTVIERDNDIPDFLQLQQEAEQAQDIMYAVTA